MPRRFIGWRRSETYQHPRSHCSRIGSCPQCRDRRNAVRAHLGALTGSFGVDAPYRDHSGRLCCLDRLDTDSHLTGVGGGFPYGSQEHVVETLIPREECLIGVVGRSANEYVGAEKIPYHGGRQSFCRKMHAGAVHVCCDVNPIIHEHDPACEAKAVSGLDQPGSGSCPTAHVHGDMAGAANRRGTGAKIAEFENPIVGDGVQTR